MGLFDFFKKKEVANLTGEELKRALFDAVSLNKSKEFMKLCKNYNSLISESFKHWQKIPDDIKAEPQKVQWYGQGMISIAQYFEQAFGDSSLMQIMMGDPKDNPLVIWQESFEKSCNMIESEEYESAIKVLTELIEDFKELSGSGVDQFLPITYGKLGEALFQSGKVEDALKPTLKAIDLCENVQDLEGVLAYNSNIHEMYRYLNLGDKAKFHALKLAELYENNCDHETAEYYKERAQMCEKGEPLLRVVGLIENRKVELDKLPPQIEGRCQFIFERNKICLEPCERMVSQGKAAGSENNFDKALKLFEAAAEKDEFSPEPFFHMGFTLLHLKKYTEACGAYDEVEKRAPGWYHSRTDRYLAELLISEKIRHENWLTLTLLEDGLEPLTEKLKIAEALAGEIPNCDLALYQLAEIHHKIGDNEAAYKSAVAALKISENFAVKTRILLLLGLTAPEKAQAHEYLEQAKKLNGNLVAAATAQMCLSKFHA